MASSSGSGVGTMSVCQTCGDKGEMNLLIYCMKCQDSAVHHYCLDTFSPDDDEIAWMCEECSPKVAMVAPSRSSGRIEPRKQRRRLLLVEEDSSEEFESVKDEVPSLVPYGHYGPSNIACSQPSMESDNDVPAQPVMDPIWRGCFSIKNEKNETLFGLMAHLSSKACSKVYDAANLLPPVLDVEILPRCDAWPKPFQMSPPSDDRIALYFFPENERDEKAFDSLLDEIIELNLSLKAVINGGVELLVFSSLELPQQHWRFRRKYYMWGVFRKKRVSSALVPTNHPVLKNSSDQCVTPCKGAESQGARALAKTMTTQSPRSPPSTGSSRVSNPSHSPFPTQSYMFLTRLSIFSHLTPNHLGLRRQREDIIK